MHSLKLIIMFFGPSKSLTAGNDPVLKLGINSRITIRSENFMIYSALWENT